MSCPKCKSSNVVSVMSMSTPKGHYPFQCLVCRHRWDAAALPEPVREWRLNEVGDGNFRLVELADGKLVGVGLQYKKTLTEEEAAMCRDDVDTLVRKDVREALAGALAGMLEALKKPLVRIRQVMEEVTEEVK